ncbi:hypothetical protein FQN54_004475 [Arachnomyces sp. PD_36]|nr:hypothetical protein FQN54_004475 [Arachnomyces sp. PD_36]
MSTIQPSLRKPLLLLSRSPQSASSYQKLLPPSTSPTPSTCQLQLRRPFSHTPAHRAAPMGTTQTVTPKVPAQQSNRSRMKTMTAKDIPSDIGLLPGTFIRPTGDNMPSIFQEPSDRLRMEWLYWKTKVLNFIGLVAYAKFMNKKVPLLFRERKPAALDLHKKMYTAFAEADHATLHSICCDGLKQDFSRRIHNRSSKPLTWTLHKYYRSPPLFSTAQIMSDRATSLPGVTGAGLRQVVVRIRSRQSTVKHVAGETEAEVEAGAALKQKDCVENVVIQKQMFGGKQGEWKVWGVAEDTTADDLDGPHFKGLSMTDRLTAMKDRISG